MALIIPSIYEAMDKIVYFKDKDNAYYIYYCFQIAEYFCIFLAELVFVVVGVKKLMSQSIILSAAILYYASSITFNIYAITQFESYNYVFDIAIKVLCLCTVVFALSHPRFLLSAIILLLIDSAFNLSSTFSGSTLGFSSLILSVMLIFAVYFCCIKPDNDEVDYNIYS